MQELQEGSDEEVCLGSPVLLGMHAPTTPNGWDSERVLNAFSTASFVVPEVHPPDGSLTGPPPPAG